MNIRLLNNSSSGFYKVDENEIALLREKIKSEIPADLVELWNKIGYGFLISENNNVNRIMDPLSVIDFRFGQGDFEYLPDIEIYKEFQNDKLIFFESNESAYISIGISEENCCKIYYYDTQVAANLDDFFEKIKANDMYFVDLLEM